MREETKMLLHESTNIRGKIIAFADNGIISIKNDSDIMATRLTKYQATELGRQLLNWADQQPDPQEFSNPALGQASR